MSFVIIGVTALLVLVLCYLNRTRNIRRPSSIAKYADSILQDMGVYVCLINQQIEVVKTNYFTLKEGSTSNQLVGLGRIVPCSHAVGEGLCGKSEACESCPISRQVVRAFQTHRNFENLEVPLQVPYVGLTEGMKVCKVIISGRLLTLWRKEYMLLTIRDVTHVKSIEHELASLKSQLAEQERHKNMFVAGIGEDIQSVLNMVVAYTNLFVVATDDTKRTLYLERIRHNNLLLKGMMGDVMDFTRMETGTLELTYTEENLTAMMFELEAFCWLHTETDDRTIPLVMASVPSECWVVVEKKRVMLMILHLLVLVMKNVTQGCISFGYRLTEHEEICFFVRFQKGAVSSNDFGFRMSLNRRLLDLMKGSMGMEEEDGCSSVLWFKIPYQPVSGKRPEKSETSIPVDRRKSLLVAVPDDEWFERMNRSLRESYHINRVKDGETLVLEFLRLLPDGIVTFVDLPLVDGVMAKKAIRLMSRTVPVVAVTENRVTGFTAVLSVDAKDVELIQTLKSSGL